MSAFKLLVVEDDEQEIRTCRASIDRYLVEKDRQIDMVACRTVDEARTTLNNSFDGAIVDLRLSDQGDEGTIVIEEIEGSFFRIPVAILTGTPDNAREDFTYIGVFTKGEIEYRELFDRFWGIYDTGITRIVGGRGLIEETLSKVFRKNLLPKTKQWEVYGKKDSAKTEKALLRHTLNHLSQLLDEDEESCFPEEVYLAPPLTDNISTGSILKQIKGQGWFVVMNPACDLVVRGDGKRNTDWILLVVVDPGTELFPWFGDTDLSNEKRGNLKSAFDNKKAPYYHWLPKTDFFPGGFINFRKLWTIPEQTLSKRFAIPPTIQIAPSFTKDVIARFSSYYARQGQPNIDHSKFLANSTDFVI